VRVSISWLKELVDLNISIEKLIALLPLRSISIKEANPDSIELDMKGYNRADLLSMRGVAREVVAVTNSKLNLSDEEVDFPNLPKVKVTVENENLCPVYCVAKIENLKVEHSLDTWVKKLSNSGIRSINSVADVTNLIMLEFGQPMHAFDARGVKDEYIIVRRSKNKEVITTLDGKTRDLEDDLLITDSLNALGLAGVMGGKDSEITDSTTTILLEAAIFDPVSIRKTAQRHGLPSEAAKRFQHGLTKTNLLQALSAAIKMYEQMGGKLTAITLVGNLEDQPKIVELTQEKVNSLIGVNIPPEQVKDSLQKLGFSMQNQEVTVPYWRLDINIEEDLIEEVARMYGYENIPPQELRGKPPEKVDQIFPNFIYNLKKILADLGLTEIQTYSFYSSKTINDLRFTIYDLIKISNPISSETEYMRDNLWPNLLEVVAKNIKNGFKDIAIFEIGKVYIPQKEDLPKETYRVSISLMNGSDNPMQELYMIACKILNEDPDDSCLNLVPNDLNPLQLFHPKRNFLADYQGKQIGMIAEIHPRLVNKFGVEQRVAVLEVEIEALI